MTLRSLSAVAVSMLALQLPAWIPGDPSKGFTEPQRILWQAPMEKGPEAFRVEMRDGAEGSVVFESGCMRIVKSNHVGAIIVTPKGRFAAEAGSTVRAVADVETSESDPFCSLGFVRVFGRKESLSPDVRAEKPDFRFGGFRMGLLTCTKPGAADRRFANFMVDGKSGTDLTCAAVVAGAPSKSKWRAWRVEDFKAAQKRWTQEKRRRRSVDFSSNRVDAATLDRVLRGSEDHTARVVRRNGGSVLEIDGVETPPVLFKPKAWPPDGSASDGKGMFGAGVGLHAISMRLSSTLVQDNGWTDDGFDVSVAVSQVRNVMRMAPDALYLLSVRLDPPPGFIGKHSAEVWKTWDGKTVYGDGSHVVGAVGEGATAPKRAWPWVSMFSGVWREQLKANLSALVSALKVSGLSKRIVGVHFAGFHDSQFSMPYPDRSEPAVNAYRIWLKRRYGTPAALSRSWKREVVSFADVMPPDFGKDEFLDPSDMERRDCLEFLKRGPFRVLEDIARHMKGCFGKDVVMAKWCLGVFSGKFEGAYDIGEFLGSDAFDILITQPHYSRRTPGIPLGCRSPLASYRHHGKLFVNEFDLRTYGVIQEWAGLEAQMIGESRVSDDASWRAAHRRIAGMMAAEGMGYWYFDMPAGWFTPPGVRKDISDALKDRLGLPPRGSWKPSAALVVDEDGALLRNLPSGRPTSDTRLALIEQVETLAGSGVPFDVWLVSDLLSDPSLAASYRTLVFSEMPAVDAPRRRLLTGLARDGRSLVFLKGCGRIEGADLTGYSDVRPSGKPGKKMFRLHGVPDYCVPGANCSGLPDVSLTEFDGWRRMYVHDPCGLLPAGFNRLVRLSGGYVAAPAGVQVNTNGRFMSVHSLGTGRFDLRFPADGTAVDMETGAAFPVPEGVLSVNLVAGETRWYLLNPADERKMQ